MEDSPPSTTAPPVFPGRRSSALDQCHEVHFPVIADPRGNLTFVEGGDHVPFDIARVFYLYDVPGGASRGGHAHRELQQVIIAASGSFDVNLDDGERKQVFHLNRSYNGIYVGPMVWQEIDNFSSGSVCLVLASMKYDESDYYRDYDEFVHVARAGSAGPRGSVDPRGE